MKCRVTSSKILALHSMTKEEQVMKALEVKEEEEEMIEVEDQSLAIVVDSKDNMPETITNPPQYVNIANHMNILLKTALFYRGSGRKRDHSWETRMFISLELRAALCPRILMSSREVD